jgi:hypothetical protein
MDTAKMKKRSKVVKLFENSLELALPTLNEALTKKDTTSLQKLLARSTADIEKMEVRKQFSYFMMT